MPKLDTFVAMSRNGKEATYPTNMLRGLKCFRGDRLILCQEPSKSHVTRSLLL